MKPFKLKWVPCKTSIVISNVTALEITELTDHIHTNYLNSNTVHTHWQYNRSTFTDGLSGKTYTVVVVRDINKKA